MFLKIDIYLLSLVPLISTEQHTNHSRMETVKFGEIELPCHPFVWIYDQYLLKILSSNKYENADIILSKFKNKNDILQTLNLIKNYSKDFYEVTQEIENLPSTEFLNISFHSWYFSKYGKSNVMTSEYFKTNIFTGIFIFTDDTIISPKIENDVNMTSINTCDMRKISVHNIKLSPKSDNSFLLKEMTKEASFVSVAFCPKLKKACITLHNIIIT